METSYKLSSLYADVWVTQGMTTSYDLSYNLRFNRLYRRRVKFLPLKKNLSLKLLRLRMLKETI